MSPLSWWNRGMVWWVLAVGLAGISGSLGAAARQAWKPADGPLLTRWAQEVSPTKVHPEYPRPQMVRKDWLNLNGLWDYAITARESDRPAQWDGQILVPFPVESALSGVMKRVSEEQRLWYQRSVRIPRGWKGQRVFLHFGAVDWETTVWVNGREIGTHRGGYDAFRFDVTDALRPAGDQEIVVAVWDPTDAGYQPRGKQVRKPSGIWYTPTTGIWQTVWLEPVADTHIRELRITPDFDRSAVTVAAHAQAEAGPVTLEVTVLDGRRAVQHGTVTTEVATRSIPPLVSPRITLPVPDAKAWSPDTPCLYDLQVVLKQGGRKLDEVRSYFGMRKIALGKDADGIWRLCLNNEPLFQYGPLDQGFWPDGLYTAPTDAALRYDIEMTKALGFNMARKHVKIEPARWYYWCDKLGLLVWQDMPSGDRYIGSNDPDITRTPESARQFETELRAMIDGFYNHPSIVMWVPYNEGWGQWDTARIVDLVKSWDPTRLVNNASGWTDRRVGDVLDIHAYPGPAVPRLEENRAVVLGEFGGLGLPIRGHTWQDERNWGYRSYSDSGELTDAYLELLDKLHPMTGLPGLAAAVYTQTTDVEIEVNGLMTYDRALVKMDAAAITAAARRLYTPPPRRVQGDALIPPSTPLVACDPYFSIWSPADQLNEANTVHWTGRPHRLAGMVRVDGKPYRVLGAEPRLIPALPQTGLTVLPTRTLYEFAGAGIALTLTFMNAALPSDVELLSRPVTYVTWDVRSTDGRRHAVSVYFDASGELTVNETRQQVQWSTESAGDLVALKVGSVEQPILAKRGDDLRIDWGHLYVAAPRAALSAAALASRRALQQGFVREGAAGLNVPDLDAPAHADSVGAALVLDLGVVAAQPVSRWLMVAYDDLFSIQYFRQNLRPYWRRSGWEAPDLLKAAAADYPDLLRRCAEFDAGLMADLRQAGGEEFAQICALAYRQCFAASKFVADANGQVMSFSKENFSNGCIGTADVFYPMAPQFLLFGPSLAKSFLVPFMDYAASERWRFPFAPHDLGTYPHANGQRYGGGERSEENQMPVEESGNLLILMAAVAQMEGNAGFAARYWPQLTRWAEYLKEKGYDPENQLCTDDFAGHMAHNVNLSAKAICGLAAYAKLARMQGHTTIADEYAALAREFAGRWMKEADDGTHFRLAFDRTGTWSQKYNLVWDRILGLDLFPDTVRRKEMDHYRRVQNRYGLPLDNRSTYTKLDWILWSATLTQSRDDFLALVQPVYRFLNETPDRVPMTDWYWTLDARRVGFQARPVVGGVFLQMLYDPALWAKHAQRDRTRADGWAPFPTPPRMVTLVPTAEEQPIPWRYTTRRPDPGWVQPDFDDSSWSSGPAGFGTRGTPGAVVRTEWNSSNIWLRREFELSTIDWKNPHWMIHHDEDVEVFINGTRVLTLSGYTTGYETLMLSDAARTAFKQGRNVIAVRCRQTGGGQYIDVGLSDLVPLTP
jgi:hypothetical protein